MERVVKIAIIGSPTDIQSLQNDIIYKSNFVSGGPHEFQYTWTALDSKKSDKLDFSLGYLQTCKHNRLLNQVRWYSPHPYIQVSV